MVLLTTLAMLAASFTTAAAAPAPVSSATSAVDPRAHPAPPTSRAAAYPLVEAHPVAPPSMADEPVRIAAHAGGPTHEERSDTEEAADDEGDVVDGVDPETEEHDVAATGPVDDHRYSSDVADDVLQDLFEHHPERLGSVSIGFTDSGRQLNAVQFPKGEDGAWVVVDPHESWGTKETIDYVVAAARQVAERMPGPPLRVNDISKKDGGWLRPHHSHQAGRDVDLGLFYPDASRCTKAREKCMDVARNWALVRALVTTGDVQFILVDKRIQAVLYAHALSIGEDKAWLDSLFHGGSDALVKHARRHRDHFHVRYYAPRSQELGRRLHPLLAKLPDQNVITYRIKNGDSLGKIAGKFGTTVNALKKQNGLKNNFLRAGRSLSVTLRGPCTTCPVPPPVVVPPRRLPPDMVPTAETPVPVTLARPQPTPVVLASATTATTGSSATPDAGDATQRSTTTTPPMVAAAIVPAKKKALSSSAAAALAAGLARLDQQGSLDHAVDVAVGAGVHDAFSGPAGGPAGRATATAAAAR
jgi:LysM repeat protein/murein endopeptidase